MAIHDVGDVVTLWVVFRDEAGTQADPTTVTLTVREPDGTVVEVAAIPVEAGNEALAEAATGQTLSGVTGAYVAEVEVTQSGTWRYEWEGTGAVDEVEGSSFYVRPDMVGEVSGS